jgi:hypothetical protein
VNQYLMPDRNAEMALGRSAAPEEPITTFVIRVPACLGFIRYGTLADRPGVRLPERRMCGTG